MKLHRATLILALAAVCHGQGVVTTTATKTIADGFETATVTNTITPGIVYTVRKGDQARFETTTITEGDIAVALIVPPDGTTNQVQVIMETSTNLVHWTTATNGNAIYASPGTARFFRLTKL